MFIERARAIVCWEGRSEGWWSLRGEVIALLSWGLQQGEFEDYWRIMRGAEASVKAYSAMRDLSLMFLV